MKIGMTGNVGTGNILSCAPTKSLSLLHLILHTV